MGYSLEAFLGSEIALSEITRQYASARLIGLNGIAMIPMTDEFYDECVVGETGKPYLEFWKLATPHVELAVEASQRGLIAYVEADFFGGTGKQAAILWRDGLVVAGPFQEDNFYQKKTQPIADWPINRILREMGIGSAKGKDEFETVGLHQHRHMEDWISGTN